MNYNLEYKKSLLSIRKAASYMAIESKFRMNFNSDFSNKILKYADDIGNECLIKDQEGLQKFYETAKHTKITKIMVTDKDQEVKKQEEPKYPKDAFDVQISAIKEQSGIRSFSSEQQKQKEDYLKDLKEDLKQIVLDMDSDQKEEPRNREQIAHAQPPHKQKQYYCNRLEYKNTVVKFRKRSSYKTIAALFLNKFHSDLSSKCLRYVDTRGNECFIWNQESLQKFYETAKYIIIDKIIVTDKVQEAKKVWKVQKQEELKEPFDGQVSVIKKQRAIQSFSSDEQKQQDDLLIELQEDLQGKVKSMKKSSRASELRMGDSDLKQIASDSDFDQKERTRHLEKSLHDQSQSSEDSKSSIQSYYTVKEWQSRVNLDQKPCDNCKKKFKKAQKSYDCKICQKKLCKPCNRKHNHYPPLRQMKLYKKQFQKQNCYRPDINQVELEASLLEVKQQRKKEAKQNHKRTPQFRMKMLKNQKQKRKIMKQWKDQ